MAVSMQQVSKFMSFVLRHRPDQAGLVPDGAGFVSVAALVDAVNARFPGIGFGTEQLEAVVAENDKKRYEYDAAGARIRACQGHSIAVDLGLRRMTPPAALYHGTQRDAVAPILREGIARRRRHHVHLSESRAVAGDVGRRRGVAVVLTVLAGRMDADGIPFYRSANGVWLVDHVPPGYIRTE